MDNERRQRPADQGPRPAEPQPADAAGRGDAAGPASGQDAATGPPSAVELEIRARELERRAVDADAAVAAALDGRSGADAPGSAGSISASELRHLRVEADLLMDRAIAARLEADRAADEAAADGGSPGRVLSWNHPEWGWERLLAAALDEVPSTPPAAPPASPNGAAGGHREPSANGSPDPHPSAPDRSPLGRPDGATPVTDPPEG